MLGPPKPRRLNQAVRDLLWRDLLDANIQGLLIATGQNLKRFAGRDRLGGGGVPPWEPPFPFGGARPALGRLLAITDRPAARRAGELSLA